MDNREFSILALRFEENSSTDDLCRDHLDELLSIQKRFRDWLDNQPKYAETDGDWHNGMTTAHIAGINVRSFADATTTE